MILLLPSFAAIAYAGETTTSVIVLGVDHSTQLVARGDQPAALDAFLERAKPDAICVERAPDAFARNDFYEFTYEVQSVVLPYAQRNRIDLCPVDWEPPREDQLLGFGIDLEMVPELRPTKGFQQFLSFPPATLQRRLLDADNPDNLSRVVQWAAQPAAKAADDLPRRLYLYRTYMQAKRLAHAAKARPGGTVVLVVGEFHKRDIEAILAGDPAIELVQPSTVGEPTADEVARHDRREYRLAIAAFNLLGVQAQTGNVDFAWLRVERRQGWYAHRLLFRSVRQPRCAPARAARIGAGMVSAGRHPQGRRAPDASRRRPEPAQAHATGGLLATGTRQAALEQGA
jgi:hypothetical protein